jgi:hypothetical protein
VRAINGSRMMRKMEWKKLELYFIEDWWDSNMAFREILLNP